MNDMTEEEMAEEWVKANCDDSLSSFRGSELQKAFLAGLKAGKDMNISTKWHDLREDPNDLPKSSIFNEVLNENGCKIYYDDVDKAWKMFFNGNIVRANTPKVWCEIPKYTEE